MADMVVDMVADIMVNKVVNMVADMEVDIMTALVKNLLFLDAASCISAIFSSKESLCL